MAVPIDFRYRVYAMAKRYLPSGVIRFLRSRLLRPMRNLWFRSGGDLRLVERNIVFEGLRFTFQAPLTTVERAERRGIETKICRLLMAECAPGSVCIDVGASFGFITSVLCATTGSEGRVIAVEADAPTQEGLLHNVRRNGWTERCDVVHAFAGEAEVAGSGTPRVTVDGLVDRLGLDTVTAIKIDTDGGDLAVLQGCRKTLARFQPVLVVELEADHQAIADILTAADYELADMSGRPLDLARPPPNLFAARGRLLCPPPPSGR